MMKKNVVIFVMSIFAMYVSAYEYKGSSNGCLERAPCQIADGNVETYWSLEEDEIEGWLEVLSEKAEKKEFVYIDCEIPENAEIQLYEKNGNGQASLSSCFKEGPFIGEIRMNLPKMRRESSVLGIKLLGKNASKIKIKEVKCDLRGK